MDVRGEEQQVAGARGQKIQLTPYTFLNHWDLFLKSPVAISYITCHLVTLWVRASPLQKKKDFYNDSSSEGIFHLSPGKHQLIDFFFFCSHILLLSWVFIKRSNNLYQNKVLLCRQAKAICVPSFLRQTFQIIFVWPLLYLFSLVRSFVRVGNEKLTQCAGEIWPMLCTMTLVYSYLYWNWFMRQRVFDLLRHWKLHLWHQITACSALTHWLLHTLLLKALSKASLFPFYKGSSSDKKLAKATQQDYSQNEVKIMCAFTSSVY